MNKNVLFIVTEDERQELKRINDLAAAYDSTINYLVEQKVDVMIKCDKWWQKISDKYKGKSTAHMFVDSNTGEVFERKNKYDE